MNRQNPATSGIPRLASLDALRGFDMLWIIGGDAISGALAQFHGGAVSRFLAPEMQHVDWEGFHFYDLIFPLFIFMVGVAITLSLDRIAEKEGRPSAVRRVVKRGLLLYVLGLLYYGGISEGYEHIRLMGVLQRIAICYTAAGLLYLYLSTRALIAVCLGLLIGYWMALTYIPIPFFGAGDFAPDHNLANWIDSLYLPLRRWDGNSDPEGLLSTLPAIASCLIGVFAGLILKSPRSHPMHKVGVFVFGGLALVALGWTWGLQFPVIKHLWTSSFVLVAGGWSLVLLGAFYYVIDILGWKAWAQPLVWIGSNALFIYLVSSVVNFYSLTARLFGGEVALFLNAIWPGLAGMVMVVAGTALCMLICRFLYKREIFIRL